MFLRGVIVSYLLHISYEYGSIILLNYKRRINYEKNQDKKSCFVITPIGAVGTMIRRKIDGLLDEVIEPILNELGYEAIVSHRINESGTMTAAIIQNVYNCDLVIANLTGNNPNVMYEVALRHASAKPIIHIAENVSELPFDINDQRTIEYTDDMSGAQELKGKLRVMIEGICYDGPVSNPVTEALKKHDLINIPKESQVEISELLGSMQGEIKELKREVAMNNRLKNYYDYSAKVSALSEKENDKEPSFVVNRIYPYSKEKGKKLASGYNGSMFSKDDARLLYIPDEDE